MASEELIVVGNRWESEVVGMLLERLPAMVEAHLTLALMNPSSDLAFAEFAAVDPWMEE
jgi:hypothetical protein